MAKVLVIEDDELLRESILHILNTREFNAIGAGDGRCGLQLAKEFVPDLILCDVRMPEMNGYEVLRSLRQDPVTASLPFIFLTAESSEDVLRQGKLLGANGYLTKPFATAELLEVLKTHLRK
ncbi:response regulator [Microcoleus sp. FACHB-SPT15]|uniref:response regulator n=1 Tax=Microcoleus sp. FACHB-SPT15 TaxID=2692830 RepID=UPI001781ED0C|nr:response regulator [Microcoleus sp. FACHB-SPT15]MBD1808906.1 response regulator [Microcoleus sp. FACHB-SPT15]